MTQECRGALVESFFQQCALAPERVAFGFAGQAFTYGQVMRLVQRIRNSLDEGAFPPERRIAILATQEVHTYAAILATLASGRAFVPIHPQQPAERNWSCLQQAATRVLLQAGASSPLQAWLGAHHTGMTVVDTTLEVAERPFRAPARAGREDLAYLLFTSGSTGTPKGVPIHHRQLAAFFDALLGDETFNFGPDDRFLQMFDLTFDLSVMSAFAPLLLGASSHIPYDKGVGYLNILRTLDRERISVALMVPSVLAFLEKYLDEIELPHLRRSLFCGEALPVSLARRWAGCAPNARLFNVYGPTEATIFCTTYEIPREPAPVLAHYGVVCIGTPMAGTRLLILDDRQRVVKSGEPGELCLGGLQVTHQYWQNPEKSSAAFITIKEGSGDLPVYRTGDVAFECDGQYFYVGRTDHQVKIAGYRVELGEIEFHARMLNSIQNAVAVAKKDAAGSDILIVFLQRNEPATADDLSEYRAALALLLPYYMMPHKIHVLPVFPLNANGKIDRKQLLKGVEDVSFS